jgi:hypothetical protein
VNLIQLVQATTNIMRGGNSQPGSQPSVYPIAAGSDQMVFDCDAGVKTAWENIQNLHTSWKWMRKRADALPIVIGARTMTLAVIQATYPRYSRMIAFDAGAPAFVNIYDSGAAQKVDQPMWFIDYENWRGYADRQPFQAAMPARFTEWPDYTLEFDPTPTAAPSGAPWFMKIDYKQTNQALAVGTDVPEMPVQFHSLIPWMAALWVCETRNSTGLLAQLAQREVYGDGKRQGRLDQLEQDQLPVILIDNMFGGYS